MRCWCTLATFSCICTRFLTSPQPVASTGTMLPSQRGSRYKVEAVLFRIWIVTNGSLPFRFVCSGSRPAVLPCRARIDDIIEKVLHVR